MQLKDIARRLPEQIWALFEPILPARIWCGNGRPPKSDHDCFHALLYVLVAGIPWELLPAGFPSYKTVRRRLTSGWRSMCSIEPGDSWPNGTRRCTGSTGIRSSSTAPQSRQKKGRTNRAVAGGPRQMRDGLAARVRWSGDAVGSGRDLGQCQRRLPHRGFARRVGRASAGSGPTPGGLDVRSLPTAQADGAYGNRPSRERAKAAGFRLQAPSRGQRRPGVGRIRQAVERCHNFFAQFGRIGRRLDRSAKRFLGWIQLAACLIFLRSGFVR